MRLVRPAASHLPSYIAALSRGWCPDKLRGEDGAREELERVRRDPSLYLERMEDRKALGDPITLPDGSVVARLPGYRRFLWDGEFCGVIGFRWQRGTP
jgi:hypothetical protein